MAGEQVMRSQSTKPKRHPAKYSDAFIPLFATILQGYGRILDPMAGTCKIGRIRDHGWQGEIHCNELEEEWASQAPDGVIVRVGDAASLPYEDGRFVLNISDHIRAGKVVPVTQWYIDTLTALGFEVEDHHRIPTPRLRHGANAGVRVECESVVVLRRVG